MDNKKYYYLKLKDNFFDTDALILLESVQDGHLYCNILLKLYLRSIKNEGKLLFNDRIPYNCNMLAQITRHPVGVVEQALKIFKELDLIEVLDNGAIYMLDIQNFIGSSSTEADRKRKYRKQIEKNKAILGQMSDKSPPEIEIELDIDIDNKHMRKPMRKNEQKCAEINDFFEKMWSLYPKKRGKGRVSMTQKRRLHAFGEEQITRCIERYEKEVQGKDDQYIKHGSTFFNTGYIDYLDANYTVGGQDGQYTGNNTKPCLSKYGDRFVT